MKIATSHLNILRAIHTLHQERVEVTPVGLCKILHGVVDFETIKYVHSNAFGYYSSISNRRLKGRINHLLSEGYLELTYDEFLHMTPLCKELVLKPLEKKEKDIPLSKNIRIIESED